MNMKTTRLDQKTIRGMMDCLVHVEHMSRRAITTVRQFSLEVFPKKCYTDLCGRCCAGTTQIRLRICCLFCPPFKMTQNLMVIFCKNKIGQCFICEPIFTKAVSYIAKEQSTESLDSRQLPCLVMCVFTLVSRGREF